MYFSEFLCSLSKCAIGTADCNNNIIRKHTRNLDKFGEFSISTDKLKLTSKNANEVELLLTDGSKAWSLRISRSFLVDNSIHVCLDRTATFQKVILQVLEEKDQYGVCKPTANCNVKADITKSNLSELSLSELRLLLLKDVTDRLLKFANRGQDGHDSDVIDLCFALNSKQNSADKVIPCGPVSCHQGQQKCRIDANEFYSNRTIHMRLMAEHKYGLRITSTAGWQEFYEKLGQAAVTVDLLQVRHNRPVCINLNDPTTSCSKGAAFILYNCARLATLFKEFNKRVLANVYPTLTSPENVDFGLLNQPEEWELLFTYVLQFPQVVSSCTKDILDCKLNIHCLCSALSGMCSVFSIYYRRIRVLTEPRTHLFPVLHARIYLLKAVEQVLHNGLHLLGIQPVKQM